jgi:hypothetical protein
LPKQIKPTDVSKVLYQLHLVPDRRSSEQSSFTALNLRATDGGLESGLALPSKALTETALREHFAELRRALVAGVDTQTDRITAEVRALLLESLPPPSEPAPTPPPPAPKPSPWPWIVASGALLIALLSTALWWRNERVLEDLSQQLANARAPLAAPTLLTPAVPAPSAPPASAQTPAEGDAKPVVLPVPYGAEPVSGTRLEAVRQVIDRLLHDHTAGTVEVRTFPGRFCVVGNATDGFSPAPDEMPFAKCDVAANPAEEANSPAQHTPLALANLIGDVRSSSHGTLELQVAPGDPANVLVPYPQPTAELTAGEWNRAAGANNRIEIRVH